MRSLLAHALDIRPAELGLVLRIFGVLLLLLAGHTVLETARDAIFLTKLAPTRLSLVYLVLAGLTFLTSAAVIGLAHRFGRRNALVATLVAAGYVSAVFYFTPPTPLVALALYVFSGLVGAMLVPQFWLLAAQLFTAAQGRRLFGPIAAGGVVGAIAGAGGAALVLRAAPVAVLLPAASAIFVLTALWLTTIEVPEQPVPPDETRPARAMDASARRLFAAQPYLWRIAGVVAISTAAVLLVDYAFKATAARDVPPARLGEFFARTYAAINGLSLVVQLFVSGRLIRRLGVVGALAFMPMLLMAGGVAVHLGGGVFAVVLALKAVDGSLRYSVHRVATELLYLPLPVETRERAKAFIDGALARIVQALAAMGLYGLAMRAHATPRTLAIVVVALSAAWLALAIDVRGPYLDLFRRALATGRIGTDADMQELDLRSAGVLVEALSSPDPVTATAAMSVLERHGMASLVPALILRHDDPGVIASAIELLVASGRTDWIPLAVRLLEHPSEAVRVAAVRALAREGRVDALEKAASDPSSRVQAYAAFHLAHRESTADLLAHPLVAAILSQPDPPGKENRRSLLAAVSDAPDERAIPLLVAFAQRPELDDDVEAIEQIAHAIAVLKSPSLVPVAIARHARRGGREAIRDALVAVGEPALDALEAALRDEATGRRVRIQVPQTIARFGSQRAADVLAHALERETDGLVRYKTLRALGRLVGSTDVRVDRRRIEFMVRGNLEEYLRLLCFRVALDHAPASAAADPSTLLTGLLADKIDQALERAFRLLKIAHRREDIHRVHTAVLSKDGRERANAGEFLDVLLARRDQQPLRELLRVIVDAANDDERLDRAAAMVRLPSRTPEAVLARLVEDRDETLAALAAYRAATFRDARLEEAIARARRARPSLAAMEDRLFAPPGDDVVVRGAPASFGLRPAERGVGGGGHA